MKMYYKDPYKSSVNTIITEINNNLILVKDIITFEEKGGQRADKGFINNIFFETVSKDDKVYLKVEKHNFKVNDEVLIKIDWTNRYEGMILHSSQHLLSGLLYSNFNIKTLSVHTSSSFSIETDQEHIDSSIIEKLVDLFNKIIKENKAINCFFPSSKELEKINLRRSIKVDKNIRLVEIKDYDLIACGGLHVKSTCELSRLYFYKQEKVRNHVRLFFLTSISLDNKVKQWISNSEKLTKLTSSTDDKIVDVVKKLYESKKEVDYKLNNITKLYIKEKIKNNILVLQTSDIDFNTCIQVSKDYEKLFICLVKEKEYLIIDKNFNLPIINILDKLNAKGSKKNPIFRGIVSNKDDLLKSIRKCLSEERYLV